MENDSIEKMATAIIVAYLNQRVVEPEQLAPLIREIRAALTDGQPGALPAPQARASEPAPVRQASPVQQAGPVAAAPAAAVIPISETIADDYIVCLEDGKRYRSLRRHLKAKYGLTPDAYRDKWGLPPDYPMVAPSYARERSSVAKRTGLGKSARPSPEQRARTDR